MYRPFGDCAAQVCVLRPLLVIDRSGREIELPEREQRELVSVLALNAGREVPAGRVLALLYSQDDIPYAGRFVDRNVEAVNSAAGYELIASTAAGYRLDVASDHVDIFTFRELWGRGDKALCDLRLDDAEHLLSRALSFWQTDPLTDLARVALGKFYVKRAQWERDACQHQLLECLRLSADR